MRSKFPVFQNITLSPYDSLHVESPIIIRDLSGNTIGSMRPSWDHEEIGCLVDLAFDAGFKKGEESFQGRVLKLLGLT